MVSGPQAELLAAIHRDGLSNNPYYELNATEWFAESFAQFTYTPQSHERLRRCYPATFAFLQKLIGAPTFCEEDDEARLRG